LLPMKPAPPATKYLCRTLVNAMFFPGGKLFLYKIVKASFIA
jgi:hypothetical protein